MLPTSAKNANPPPILLLEINEVPWRVINHYKGKYKHIDQFFRDAHSLTTLTVDEGELSPWVTWPTFHRGMDNTIHRVFNLGQDPSTFQGTPIWETYRSRGHSIGVFGSMQSWPPKDPGPNGFYVPDTFAHDARTIPEYISPLQEFNLALVSENARVVSGNPIKLALKAKFLKALIQCGVSISTLIRLAKQLIIERVIPHHKARRPIYQTVLFWDVFKKQFNPKHPPAFSTFFTNHVAGVMHRYWNHIFPDDFPTDFQPKERLHHRTMEFALSVLDDMLRDVTLWMKANPRLTVIFATSMGQGPVLRPDHHGQELTIKVDKLMSALGLEPDEFAPLLAMVPQIAAEIKDPLKRAQIKSQLEGIKTPSGLSLFKVQEIGLSLSITNQTPPLGDIEARVCKMDNGQTLAFSELGISVVQTDRGTAYHIPQGIFAVQGHLKNQFSRIATSQEIPADQIKEMILEAAGQKGSVSTTQNQGPKSTQLSQGSSL